MRNESRIFNIVGGFLLVIAGLYAWWTDKMGLLDWAGTLALTLAGGLCVMCGMYFAFVANRLIRPRPEDRPDGEHADAAGEVGFFSPSSYWPFAVGLAVVFAGLGVSLRQWWLAVAGMVAVTFASAAMVLEYYTGTRRSLD